MAAYIHGNLAVERKRTASPKVEYQTKTVMKRTTIPATEKLLYLFSIMIFVVISGVLISRVAESYENNYKMQEVKAQMESLTEQNKQLQLQISELSAPERITRIAKQELGMVPSESQVHLGQSSEGKVTVSSKQ
jgi:cell division protein FtsL